MQNKQAKQTVEETEERRRKGERGEEEGGRVGNRSAAQIDRPLIGLPMFDCALRLFASHSAPPLTSMPLAMFD